jgi:hypothetical protein
MESIFYFSTAYQLFRRLAAPYRQFVVDVVAHIDISEVSGFSAAAGQT